MSRPGLDLEPSLDRRPNPPSGCGPLSPCTTIKDRQKGARKPTFAASSTPTRNPRHDHLGAGVKGRAVGAGQRRHCHIAAALYVKLAAAIGIPVA